MNRKNTLLAGGLVALAWATAAPAYQDVLNTPAIQSPLAAKSLLNGVARAGERVVCVGQKGDVVYSDDQGKSWRQASVPVSSDLTSVYFASPQRGWAVGHDGVVLQSSDGGETWTKQLDGRDMARIMAVYYGQHPPRFLPGGSAEVLRKQIDRIVQQGPDKPFLDVWFEDESTGFVVGAFNLILRTDDGGKSWEPWYDRTENPGFLHLYAVRPVGKDLFLVGEQGLVLKLDRVSGVFRRLKVPYNGSFFGVTGSEKSVVVFGLRGNIFRSADGGKSWQKVEAGASGGLAGGTVTPEGTIVLVSQSGDVVTSADGGASFTPLESGQPFPATGVAALGGGKVAVSGILGVYVRSLK